MWYTGVIGEPLDVQTCRLPGREQDILIDHRDNTVSPLQNR